MSVYFKYTVRVACDWFPDHKYGFHSLERAKLFIAAFDPDGICVATLWDNDAEGLRRDAGAGEVEGPLGHEEPVTLLKEEVLLRDLAVLEDELVGAVGPDPHLLLLLPEAEARGPLLHDEGKCR